MEKIKILLNLINNSLDIPVIFNNQAHRRPKKPYITVQMINTDTIFPLSMKKKIIEDKKTELIKINRVENTIQFNCIGEDVLESHEIGLKLIDFFDFIERETLWSNGIGVINIGDIIDRTIKLEETKYEYISSTDITIDYDRESKKILENLQSVDLYGQKIKRRK
ncbi:MULTISPECIES: LIC_12616 family protein [Fusobacterium]|uniref:phage neck terminator protein n=1 Tax=Fusobacterium TaxID=848 RepID=UPI000E931F74|nr:MULTISPECIES: hypothetical protein [Fusobacterium]HBJ79733.1 hypothetical protein [Fusobacterium sp.]